MKINPSHIVALFLLFLFTVGCNAIQQIKEGIDKTQQPQTLISTDGKCQITVPGGWKSDTDLHEDAVIQTSQRFGELYLVVLPSNKRDFSDEMTLESLTELLRTDMKKNVKQAVSTDLVETTVNGLPGQQFEMSGEVDKIKVKYIYTVVETSNNFYQILAWTLASRYDSNKQKLLDVTNSFQEIENGSDADAPPAIKPSPAKSKF